MKLIIVLVLIVIKTTSANDEKEQPLRLWMLDEKIVTLDNYCLNTTLELLANNGDTLMNLTEAKATFKASYDACIEDTKSIRGYLTELIKIYKEKYDFTQIYCFKLALHHGVPEVSSDPKQKNFITIKDIQLELIIFGPKCNDFANASQIEVNNKNYSPQLSMATLKCKASTLSSKRLLVLETIRVTNGSTSMNVLQNLVKDYTKKLQDDLKCTVTSHSNQAATFTLSQKMTTKTLNANESTSVNHNDELETMDLSPYNHGRIISSVPFLIFGIAIFLNFSI
ncbi:unnamed protein product [Chironomus riparius]|uniref:Uncharacterized protein n=1 Tax=Chironomus riparius TaxID=315576 RepID=A0A9N9S9P1_9DIPT|nr:unnamed protein product [Chironomus riparius]